MESRVTDLIELTKLCVTSMHGVALSALQPDSFSVEENTARVTAAATEARATIRALEHAVKIERCCFFAAIVLGVITGGAVARAL